jgi:alginate O-acetyltransferase complex protein AlgJ
MKSRAIVFILVLLGCLAVLPFFNAMHQARVVLAGDEDKNASGTLVRWYNLDTLLGSISGLIYPLGISIDPDQVVIGRDGWLFLGNDHDDVIARNHAGVTAATVKAAEVRVATLAAWRYWYAQQGTVFLGEALLPNKETIYPDKTPSWATPRRPSSTDALLAMPLAEKFFDARPALVAVREAKPTELLYLKTDTHWNAWGAWLSFLSLGHWLKGRAPGLDWPVTDAIKLAGWENIPGGDLARFLRLASELNDEAPVLDDGGLNSANKNPDKKLVWVRDSFGDAWEPYVNATFGEVYPIHWRDALDKGAEALLRTIHEVKPDYVLYSVVERSAYAEAFTVPPPLLVTHNSRGFDQRAALLPVGDHDLAKRPGAEVYTVTGADPYWEFSADAGVVPQKSPILAFDLVCEASEPQNLNMQLFWADKENPKYAQNERSIAFSAKTGVNFVHLAGVPLWVLSGEVVKIRLDLETFGTCKTVGVADIRLGAFIERSLSGLKEPF